MSLHWRRWDDEFVLFDVGSGQTHLLPALTAATLMMLELASNNITELTSRVSLELGIANDEVFANAVYEAVHSLEVAGLIELVA